MKVEGSRKGSLVSLAAWPRHQNELSVMALRSVEKIRALRLICDTLDEEPCAARTVRMLSVRGNSLAIAEGRDSHS